MDKSTRPLIGFNFPLKEKGNTVNVCITGDVVWLDKNSDWQL